MTRPFRIAHLSSNDVRGGAARAAYALHRALIDSGAESTLLVQRKELNDPTVVAVAADERSELGRLRIAAERAATYAASLGPDGLRESRRRGKIRSSAILGRDLTRAVDDAAPDVLHFHWVQEGFVRPESLPWFQQPLVWTLHDQWLFSGAEHYLGDSNRWIDGYTRADRPRTLFDLDRWLFERKRAALAKTPRLTLVAPSRWMADCAKKSALLRDRRVEVIPNCIDTELFHPSDRAEARRKHGLPLDVPLVLFAASAPDTDPRKGWAELREAISARRSPFELVVAGASELPGPIAVPVHMLGVLDSSRLALAYAAADVSVCPSREEAFGLTVAEALACGTTVAAFATGGIPDIVLDRETGALASPGDALALADAIAWLLADAPRRLMLGAAGRKRAVAEFSPAVVAAKHLKLYEIVIAK